MHVPYLLENDGIPGDNDVKCQTYKKHKPLRNIVPCRTDYTTTLLVSFHFIIPLSPSVIMSCDGS